VRLLQTKTGTVLGRHCSVAVELGEEFLGTQHRAGRGMRLEESAAFTRVTQAPLQAAGLLLGDDGVAVIRKNDHEEPVETRLFQAPLG
jgi:hypothetical protein